MKKNKRKVEKQPPPTSPPKTRLFKKTAPPAPPPPPRARRRGDFDRAARRLVEEVVEHSVCEVRKEETHLRALGNKGGERVIVVQ